MMSLSKAEPAKAIVPVDPVVQFRQSIIEQAMLEEDDDDLKKRWQHLLALCNEEELAIVHELVQESLQPLQKLKLSPANAQSLAEDSELAMIGRFHAHQPTSLPRQLFERVAHLFQDQPAEDSWQPLDDWVCLVQWEVAMVLRATKKWVTE